MKKKEFFGLRATKFICREPFGWRCFKDAENEIFDDRDDSDRGMKAKREALRSISRRRSNYARFQELVESFESWLAA